MANRIWKFIRERDRSEEELASVIDDLAEQMIRGACINLPAFIGRHRRYAAEIRRLFPVLQLLARFWWQTGETEGSDG